MILKEDKNLTEKIEQEKNQTLGYMGVPSNIVEEETDICEWSYDGWKARTIVYSIMAGMIIFGFIPWIWGVIDIFRRVF